MASSCKDVTAFVVDVWTNAFDAVSKRMKSYFARRESYQNALRYLRTLLLPLKRKNGWQIAEEAGEPTPYAMQHLLDRARWDCDGMRDELRTYVCETLAAPSAILVIDETGFLKKGAKSVGVQRQYSGTAGRIENCQIGVFLAYTSSNGHALVDRELYVPKSWTEHPTRCREAKIPEEYQFATKPELAARMLGRTLDTGLSVAWVTGDTVYGSHAPLRAILEARRQAYILAVPCDEYLEMGSKRMQVDQLARQVGEEVWQHLSAGNGSKGPRDYDWACLQIGSTQEGSWQHWVLLRRSTSWGAKAPELAYFVVFALRGTTLQEMVQALGIRWTVEQCFEAAKEEVGLDEYEVRSWHGWYRHITLSMLALAFLVSLRVSAGENIPPSLLTPTMEPLPQPVELAVPVMIPLTVPEVRSLFALLLGTPSLSAAHRLAWSFWRRTHQAVAQLCHYKRSLFSGP